MKCIARIICVFSLFWNGEAAAFTYGYEAPSQEELSEFQVLPKYRAYVPQAVDLAKDMPTPGDQGDIPACVAWSITYGIQGYYERKRGVSGKILSPSFVYDALAEPVGSCTSGLRVGSAIAFLQKIGAAPAKNYPIKTDGCFPAVSSESISAASAHRLGSAFLVRGLDSVKGELYRARPVFIGVEVPSDFQQLRGPQVYAEPKYAPDGRHAMVVVGYDDSRSALKVMNSWGAGWGDGGFGWIAYDALPKLSAVFFGFEPPVQKGVSPDKTSDAEPVKVAPKPRRKEAPSVRPEVSAVETEGTVSKILSSWVDSGKCGHVEAKVVGREVRLDGVVSAASELSDLVGTVKAAVHPLKLVVKADVRPWPICELYQTVGREGLSAKSDRLRLMASTQTPKVGSTVSFTLEGRAARGYLSLFYLQADGTAVPLEKDRSVEANFTIAVGANGDDRTLRVMPPVGDEGLVAVVTNKPGLFQLSAEAHLDRDFLSNLRLSLMKAKKEESLISAGILLFKTRL